MAAAQGTERRQGGRVIDVRVHLDRGISADALESLARQLRTGDQVLLLSDDELFIALSHTEAGDVERVVLPRVEGILARWNLTATFRLDLAS